MGDDRPTRAVHSLREKFESLSTTPSPSSLRRLSPTASPDLRPKPLADVEDVKAAALRRPPPPPPPPSSRANLSRTPSPVPPPVSSSDTPPPLPSRSNQNLIARASNIVIHHDLEERYTSASTGGNSSQDYRSTDYNTSLASDEAAEINENGEVGIKLSVPTPAAALGAGIRRDSMPVTALKHETIDPGEIMARSSTHVDKRVKGPPPPPPRSRPMVPPRPPPKKSLPSTAQSAIHPELFHSDSVVQHQMSTASLVPPPLPSREKKANSDEEATLAPIPQPPPRRAVPSNLPPPTRASPAPDHPQPSLRSAISLVKSALELSHHHSHSKERPKLGPIAKAAGAAPPNSDDADDVIPPHVSSPTPLKPPPPPSRNISLGDKLPPPRKSQPSPDEDSSSSDADDAASIHSQKTATSFGPSQHRQKTLEDLPDSSDFNRKPPVVASLSTSPGFPAIPLHAQHSVYAIAGDIVCVAASSLKIYILSYIAGAHHSKYHHHVEIKDTGLESRVKDNRITAIEFRPGSFQKGKGRADEQEGRYLWCGSKDGHLWEVDVYSGEVVRIRSAAHGAAVTHILRHNNYMVTMDESGKALVFGEELVNQAQPEDSGELAMMGLLSSTPRIFRIANEQGFAKILYGKLWTSNGSGHGSLGAGGSGVGLDIGGTGIYHGSNSQVRGATIRVYDIFAPKPPLSSSGSSTSSLGRDSSVSLSTTTLPPPSSSLFMSSKSGTILQTDIGVGAVTSGCTLATQPGVVYIGHEGGYVTVWDVHVKTSRSDTSLFVLENKEPVGRLVVASVGRDDCMRFWDGLLGSDWIEGEVRKQEASYCTFRHVNVIICTWNVDAAKPEALTPCGIGSDHKARTNEANINFLEDVLKSVDRPDILVFGFQELIDLESRKLTAKTVLLGGQKQKRNADGSISDKVSRAYRLWYDRLVLAVRVAMPADSPYTVIHTENLVGLFTCIFVRNAEKAFLRDIAITTVKRGMGGRYGNKGAIVARFVIDDSSLCFINCHLAAGQHHKHSRNQDVAAVLEEKAVFPEVNVEESSVAYDGGGDGSMILDHEVVFLNGDLNYRIDQRREAVISNIQAGQLDYLLTHDQLLKEMKLNPGFRLRSFLEAPITFPPTYKYDRKSNDYDTSAKRRVPAWCDRILYRCRDSAKRVEALHYQRYEVNVSDHRPVSGGFRVKVKSVVPSKRAVVKAQVEEEWKLVVGQLLADAKEFYTAQGMI
ncbi:hypothetical protein FRC03_000891 [Tulasnella sp. 419]|nr:hypothetical protein FRC03_000891 [Tulasnella sp. 419]